MKRRLMIAGLWGVTGILVALYLPLELLGEGFYRVNRGLRFVTGWLYRVAVRVANRRIALSREVPHG